MKEEQTIEVVESYINGNISEVKQAIKKLSKAEFIDFVEGCRAHGIKLHQIRELVK